MLIGHFGAESRWPIDREERAPEKGAAADAPVRYVWFCGCGGGDMYPLSICRHLRSIFEYAARGGLPPQLQLTAEGEGAAGECSCRQKAREGAPRRRPETPGAYPRSKPCWCRSGHKFKKCHGRRGGLPDDAPKFANLDAEELEERERRPLPEDWEDEDEGGVL